MQSKAIFKFVDGSGHIIRTVDTEVVTKLIGLESLHTDLNINIEGVDFKINGFEIEVFNKVWPHSENLPEMDRGISGEYNTNIIVYMDRV